MALRYSGDVEVRMSHDARSGTVSAVVRAAQLRYAGTVLVGRVQPTSKVYDRTAALMLKRAQRWSGGKFPIASRGSRIVIRRVFQAPCPS
jgi:hypothetical protein